MAQTVWQLLRIEKKHDKNLARGWGQKNGGGAPQLALHMGTSFKTLAQTVWQILRIEI